MELRAHLVLQPLWQWLSYSCSLSRRGRYVYEAQLLWNFTAKEIYALLFKPPVMTRTMKPAEHEQCYHLTSPNGCHWLLWLDSFVVSLILFLRLFFVSEIKCLSLSWWRARGLWQHKGHEMLERDFSFHLPQMCWKETRGDFFHRANIILTFKFEYILRHLMDWGVMGVFLSSSSGLSFSKTKERTDRSR